MTIHILDTQFQGMSQVTAVYLLVGPSGPVLIETGPGSTLPAVRAALAAHGFAPADVRAVLLTHIHLDHAGAAGWWAQQGTPIYVHLDVINGSLIDLEVDQDAWLYYTPLE